VLLNQVPTLSAILLAAELTLLATVLTRDATSPAHAFARLVDPRGMFAEVVAGVFNIVTRILQVTFKLLASLFPGLRCINESCGRASGYPEEENCQ